MENVVCGQQRFPCLFPRVEFQQNALAVVGTDLQERPCGRIKHNHRGFRICIRGREGNTSFFALRVVHIHVPVAHEEIDALIAHIEVEQLAVRHIQWIASLCIRVNHLVATHHPHMSAFRIHEEVFHLPFPQQFSAK